MDVIADFAAPLPAIVTAEMLGVPPRTTSSSRRWSADFAEMLGNFQHNPDRVSRVLRSVEEMTALFPRGDPRAGSAARATVCSSSLVTPRSTATRLSEEEVIANIIVTMVGGQETTTNLIGNGLLTLLRNPDAARAAARRSVDHRVRRRGAAALREPEPAHRAPRARGPGAGR